MQPYRTTYRLGAGHLVFTIASTKVCRVVLYIRNLLTISKMQTKFQYFTYRRARLWNLDLDKKEAPSVKFKAK